MTGRLTMIATLAGMALLACTDSEEAMSPAMPVPHANNAVAEALINGDTHFYSFNGLRQGKTWKHASQMAFVYDTNARQWHRLADVPVAQGRLASIAVGVKGTIYLFGGYTVAQDGTEVSTPEVFAFEADSQTYRRLSDMPTPVDDTVALTHSGRYIYLVSGWHNDGNVALTQVYDIIEDRWFRATDWPGAPVFGHAGGIVDNRIVVVDGVAVLGTDDAGRRRFGLVDQAWLGEIDPDDPTIIDWQRLPPHPGQPLYRAAARGLIGRNQVIVAGGSPNAYNYDGIGYNGEPSPPSARIFAYDFDDKAWVTYADKPVASMDHRGLVRDDEGRLFTIGGMVTGQRVTGRVLGVPLIE